MSLVSTAFSVLPVEWLINYSIDIAKTVIDKYVDGNTLDESEIKVVQCGYINAKIWLKQLVEDSETTRDDKAYNTFIELCEDTAAEGGFALPVLDEPETETDEPTEETE